MRYAADAVKVVRLSSKDPQAWALMPQIRDRILAFAITGGDKHPDTLVERVTAAFVLGLETWVCWVVVRTADYQVIAHLLACDDEWNGHPVGFVMQVEAEPGALSMAAMAAIQGELRAWAKGMGHTRILMSTRRARFRAWARLFQFTAWRIIMSDEGFHADD